MRLTRLFVERELAPGSVMELPPESAARLARVLRARGGDAIVLFNGNGEEFAAVIESVRGTRVTAAVGAGRRVDRESPLAATLIQCVPRGDRMDWIVQKSVELGVAALAPVISQRSVVRLDHAQAESKSAHWRGVAVSACEQCGRNRIPDIGVAMPLLDYLGALAPPAGTEPRWVLDPEPEDRPAETRPAGSLRRVHVAVGPEGGFAPDELEAFRVSGFSRLALGPRILRTETAAVAALAWLQSHYGDM